MATRDRSAIRVSSPADLVEAVPYLLGFHPTESLVVIGLAESGSSVRQVEVTARLDLAPSGVDEPALDSLLRVLSGAAEAAAVLVHTDTIAGDPHAVHWLTDLVERLTVRLAALDIALVDALMVNSANWWSLSCSGNGCCPTTGTSRRPQSSLVAAEATFAGLVALPDRLALQASLAGEPDELRAVLTPALGRAGSRLTELIGRNGRQHTVRLERAAVMKAAADCQGGTRLSDRRLVRIGAALGMLEVRDAVWLAIDDRSLDASQLLGQLHSRLPGRHRAAPLFLLGWQQWRAGNATLAGMAAAAALRADPGYSAARLLNEAVELGMDPRRTPPLTAGRGHRLPA